MRYRVVELFVPLLALAMLGAASPLRADEARDVGFTFEDADRTFRETPAPSDRAFYGRWIIIGFTMAQDHILTPRLTNAYHPEGWCSDRGVEPSSPNCHLQQLVFAPGILNPSEMILTPSAAGFGPVNVRTGENHPVLLPEDRSFQMSYRDLDPYDSSMARHHVTWSCKPIDWRMLCSETLHLEAGETSWHAFDGRVIGYDLLVIPSMAAR